MTEVAPVSRQMRTIRSSMTVLVTGSGYEVLTVSAATPPPQGLGA